jgi:hypothetical protein
MKKRIIIAIAVALLTLTAASSATATGDIFDFGSGSAGVLVRQDGGYMITGTLRNADSQIVGTIHGTLIELTTGFNTCPIVSASAAKCGPFNPGIPPYICNLLGGEVTLNLQGTVYDAFVGYDLLGHASSALCLDPDHPTSYRLFLLMNSTSHVPPATYPDFYYLIAAVQQMNATLFKWSS